MTLVVARSEMGQGVRTSLAMILAEELEADWSSVSIEQASPSPDYEDMSTGGSDSVASSWGVLRKAAAAARAMLVDAAARRWKAPAGECRAEKGFVVHAPTGRRLGFGALAADAARLPVPKEPPLKDPKDFRIVGTRVPRIDGPAIVTGPREVRPRQRGRPTCSSRRSRDARWPAESSCASTPRRRRRFPASAAPSRSRTASRFSRPTRWAALSGRDALEVVWDEGGNAALSTEELGRRLDEAAARTGHVSRKEGDVDGGACRRGEEVLGHLPRRVPGARLRRARKLDRAGRRPGAARSGRRRRIRSACSARRRSFSAIDPEKVRVHVTLIGGGFGRRLGADYAVEAVEVARAAGRAVQVVWSRADEFGHDFLHPAGRADVAAGVDASGRIVAWTHRFTTFHLSMFGAFDPNAVDEPDVNPWGGYDNPYAIDNLRVEWTDVESPVPTGAWRSVFYPPNVFARECFIDEIAHDLGEDPLALRRRHLDGKIPVRHRAKWIGRSCRAVLDLAAEKAGWGSPLPERPGAALRAAASRATSTTAGRSSRRWRRSRSGTRATCACTAIVTALDCGQVVNPLGLEGQVESGVAWALSYALKGEITIEKGRVVETSYREFPVLPLGEMPEVEVYTVASASSSGRPASARCRFRRSLPPSPTRSSRRPGSACAGCRSAPKTCAADSDAARRQAGFSIARMSQVWRSTRG